MPKDLTIRLLGRPQVSEDDQVGYHKVTRQYVIEAYRSEYSEINHPENPLFLPVGTEDEEFTGHYLVDQKINPAQGTLDKAYLVRVFAEIRNTYVQESVQVSNDLRRVRRTYVVLRTIDNLGYSSSEFSNHPQNSGSSEPWDYAPTLVKTPPPPVGYNLPQSRSIIKEPGVGIDDNQSLYAVLNSRTDVNTGVWLKGSAQVSMSQPGVDVWSVEWVTHSAPYWSAGVKRGGSSSFKPPKVVSFDHNGLKIIDFGSGGGSVAYNQIGQFNFFVVADTLPTDFASYWGGAANITPSVFVDFKFQSAEAGSGSFGHKQLIPNAVFTHYLNDKIMFPKKDGSEVQAATYNASERSITLDGEYQSSGGSSVKVNTDDLPRYQATPMIRGGGIITWNHVYNASSTYANIAGVQIVPAFTSAYSKEHKKIWRVSITYVG